MFKPLAKSVLIPLGLTAVASVTDVVIQKKIFGSGTITLIISNEEMTDIMKIFNYPEESGLLIKCVIETIKNEAKEQEEGFLGILLGTVGAILLKNLLTGKSTNIAAEGTIKAGGNF